MTIELLIMEDIVKMLESNRSFKDLDENDISKLVRRVPISTDIQEIDVRMKKILDSLAIRYGLLDALIRLQDLRWELIECINTNGNNIRFLIDMRLIKDVVEGMIDMVSKAYSINIYLSVLYAFLKMKKGKDIDVIMESFLDEKIPTAVMLGLRDDECIQLDMFDDCTTHVELSSLVNYVSLKNNALESCVRITRNCFTKSEVIEYLNMITLKLKEKEPRVYDLIKPILQTFKASFLENKANVKR